MKSVDRYIEERTIQLFSHSFFAWMNGCERGSARTAYRLPEDRFLFSPILVEFIMGFADMNKWFLSYASPSSELHSCINEHTLEDRTHSRLFVEDWLKLRLNERLGWSASDTLWWWFDCSETELVRRLAMETLELTVTHPDPLVRFPQIQAIEAVGSVFFANTVALARHLEQLTGLEYRYYGLHHMRRETGHLHTDEDIFKEQSLTDVQRKSAMHLVDRMFDMFVEELDHLYDYSRRVTDSPAALLENLRKEQNERLAARGSDSSRWPAGPKRTVAPSPSQAAVAKVFEDRMRALEDHAFMGWLRSERSVAPIDKLRRFVAMWAVDILGYRDMQTYVLPYRKARSAEERAINRWTKDLASHSILYLADWRALDLDRLLGWTAHKVIEFYFLDGHTELHRHNMAKVKTYAFAHPEPRLRYWLMRSLEATGEVLFSALRPVVSEIESTTPIRLDYWAERHALVHPHLESDSEADAVAFVDAPLSPDEAKVAIDIVNCIFDNAAAQFALSLELAKTNYFAV
jgi:hypothetical protein